MLVVGVVALAAVLYLIGRSQRRSGSNSFVGSPTNDKEVIVQGWSEIELARILSDFENKYAGQLGSAYSVVLQKRGSAMRLSFPKDIPEDEFCFLVNYIYYPEGFDLKSRSIVASGRATLSDGFGVPDKALIGRVGIFYVPSNDHEYDLVYVRVGDRTFENSFASTRWKAVDDPRFPPGLTPL